MRINDCRLKICAGLFSTFLFFSSSFAQSSTNTFTLAAPAQLGTSTLKVEQSLSVTVGELLKRDAADALNPPVAKDASAVLAAALVKPVIKGPDPFLTAIFGMEGARSVRLQLPDKPILTYVENERDTDKREPNWRLLAVEGRCAYFENLTPPSKKQKPAKGIQEKICYKRPQEILRLPSLSSSGNLPAIGPLPLAQQLPPPMRP